MEKTIYIRRVKRDDLEEVFNLSNQDYVRKYSINREKIKWENHVNWFNSTIQDHNNVFYVITDNTERFFGQIRYKIENDEAIVSISLSQLITGKGLSRPLLLESIDKLFSEKNAVTQIVAYVSEDNLASLRLFEKSGFSYCGIEKGLLKYIYSKGE